tara:strand:+ start:100 stop:609 length:510 start_codon:yes stop_codon:yes gene_type:complete
MPRIKLENMSITKVKENFSNSNAATNPQKTAVNSAYKMLDRKKLTNGSMPTDQKDIALDVLASLNITILEDRGIDYSFKKDRTTQAIKNKNIVDKDLDKLTNTLTSPNNKFVNKDDPFYEMDAAPSIHEQEHIDHSKNLSKPDTSQIVQDLFTQNMVLGHTTPTLKQFK